MERRSLKETKKTINRELDNGNKSVRIKAYRFVIITDFYKFLIIIAEKLININKNLIELKI